MKNHPVTRSHRRELAKKYAEPIDAFGKPVNQKDKYTPNKSRMIHCPQCRKEKLQFESEEKANRYIEYNADRIKNQKGKAPIRSYYCTTCCCWHVTSKEKYRPYFYQAV